MAKILVVDDDPIIIEMLTLKFQADGHQVVSAVDAYVVTLAALNFKPDLIPLDFELPASNGFAILARLQANNTVAANTPVIFISGVASYDRQPSVPVGPNIRFLRKPVNLEKLAACVADLLKNASAPDGDSSGGDIRHLDAKEP